MTVLVTGSSGHLGEALMRTLRASGCAAVGLDLIAGPFTDEVGSVSDLACVARCIDGADTVFHAATLHKPHVGTHSRAAFVETNVMGTLVLLEAAARARVRAFVMTSTTSAFGDALKPPPGAPAAWIDERVAPCAQEYLWRDQDGGGGSLPIVSSQRAARDNRAEDIALLSRGG